MFSGTRGGGALPAIDPVPFFNPLADHRSGYILSPLSALGSSPLPVGFNPSALEAVLSSPLLPALLTTLYKLRGHKAVDEGAIKHKVSSLLALSRAKSSDVVPLSQAVLAEGELWVRHHLSVAKKALEDKERLENEVEAGLEDIARRALASFHIGGGAAAGGGSFDLHNNSASAITAGAGGQDDSHDGQFLYEQDGYHNGEPDAWAEEEGVGYHHDETVEAHSYPYPKHKATVAQRQPNTTHAQPMHAQAPKAASSASSLPIKKFSLASGVGAPAAASSVSLLSGRKRLHDDSLPDEPEMRSQGLLSPPGAVTMSEPKVTTFQAGNTKKAAAKRFKKGYSGYSSQEDTEQPGDDDEDYYDSKSYKHRQHPSEGKQPKQPSASVATSMSWSALINGGADMAFGGAGAAANNSGGSKKGSKKGSKASAASSAAASLPAHRTVHTERGKQMKPEIAEVLMTWLLKNITHPFPSAEDKGRLMAQTGLDADQLRNWFTNARKRHLTPLQQGRAPRSQLELLMVSAAAAAANNGGNTSSGNDMSSSSSSSSAAAGAGAMPLSPAFRGGRGLDVDTGDSVTARPPHRQPLVGVDIGMLAQMAANGAGKKSIDMSAVTSAVVGINPLSLSFGAVAAAGASGGGSLSACGAAPLSATMERRGSATMNVLRRSGARSRATVGSEASRAAMPRRSSITGGAGYQYRYDDDGSSSDGEDDGGDDAYGEDEDSEDEDWRQSGSRAAAARRKKKGGSSAARSFSKSNTMAVEGYDEL